MKKIYLEVISSVGSVAILILLTIMAKIIFPSSPGYGFTAALLIFVIIMGVAGIRLAEIPDK